MNDLTLPDSARSESHGFSAAVHDVIGREREEHFGHRHADIEVHCWQQPVEFLLAGRVLSLPPGIPIVFWAGNPHFHIQPRNREVSRISWITLPIAWLHQWNLTPDFISAFIAGEAMYLSEDPVWGERMPEWVSLIQQGGTGRQIARLELQAFLLRLQQHHRKAGTETASRTMPRAVQTALVWLLDHFKEIETARDVSQALGYNHKYLMTAFRQHVGQTLQVYLNQLRVMEAQRMLMQTDASVTTIALDCGFQSQGRFYASLRKFCGQSPRQFRLSLTQP